MNSKKRCSPDVMVEVLSLLKRKLPIGVGITNDDWNKAYDIVRAGRQIDTLQWKLEHIGKWA